MRGLNIVLFMALIAVTVGDGVADTTIVPPGVYDVPTAPSTTEDEVTWVIGNASDVTTVPVSNDGIVTVPTIPGSNEGDVTIVPKIPSVVQDVSTIGQPLAWLSSLFGDESSTEGPESDGSGDLTTPESPCDDDEDPTDEPKPESNYLGDQSTVIPPIDGDEATIPLFVGGGGRRAIRRFRRSPAASNNDDTLTKCVKTVDGLKTDTKDCQPFDQYEKNFLEAAKKSDWSMTKHNLDFSAFFSYPIIIGKIPSDSKKFCIFLNNIIEN